MAEGKNCQTCRRDKAVLCQSGKKFPDCWESKRDVTREEFERLVRRVELLESRTLPIGYSYGGPCE